MPQELILTINFRVFCGLSSILIRFNLTVMTVVPTYHNYQQQCVYELRIATMTGLQCLIKHEVVGQEPTSLRYFIG